MCRITYSTKLNQIKIVKIYLEILILQYDVIHDALEVLCYKNLKRSRNFGDLGSFGLECAQKF